MRSLKVVAAVTAVALSSWSGVAAAAPKSVCAELNGVGDIGQPCQIQTVDPAYKLDITFPTDYPDQKSVSEYVTQIRDGFLNVAKSSAPRNMPYELDLTSTEYSSAIPPRGTKSVVFKVYQNVGGAHPETWFKAFNWDQGYRKPITFETLFQPEANPLPVIYPIVAADLQKQAGLQQPIPPSVGLDPTKYENFAVTNDTVIFFFGQGEVLPEAAGAVQVTVPRAAIDSMIA